MHSLEAKIRTKTARETRKDGSIPAVVYGKDVPSTSIVLDTSGFIRLYRDVGKNHVFNLKIEKKEYPVLIHDIQKHPVTGKVLHVDFLVVDIHARIRVQIPIILIGTSPAVLAGGQIHQSLHSLDVKCLPNDVIDAFELDISSIDHIGKTLHVSDLSIDTQKYQVLSHPEVAIVGVHAVKEHKEETESVSVSDVEVATEKKKVAEESSDE